MSKSDGFKVRVPKAVPESFKESDCFWICDAAELTVVTPVRKIQVRLAKVPSFV
jgi:hypothetical protein